MTAFYIPPVINDLTTGGVASSLSAQQGVVLKADFDSNVLAIVANTAAIAAKADDSAVVHLVGAETITGGKTVEATNASTVPLILKLAASFSTFSFSIHDSGSSSLFDINNFGSSNLFIGAAAGNFTLTGSGNQAVGGYALRSLTSGLSNTMFGIANGQAMTTGSLNTGIGQGVMAVATTASDCSGYGYGALAALTTGYNNTAGGSHALYLLTTGFSCSSYGIQAGFRVTTASYLCAYGDSSFAQLTTGNFNTGYGIQSGYSIFTGSNNSFFGSQADATGDYSFCSAFGNGAKATADHQIMLGTSSETVVMPGSAVIAGGLTPGHMADSSAANDSIYYSTTLNKLAYKDAGGTVNALY